MLTINNTLDGYLKDVEILGNTIQSASNLADIRSVGDKVEGQELYEIPVVSCGKNLFDKSLYYKQDSNGWSPLIPLDANKMYICKYSSASKTPYIRSYDENKVKLNIDESFVASGRKINTSNGIRYISIQYIESLTNIQLEEGTVATPYEPYQEDKLTILSPVQLEKVGDVRDRIIEKDGVWGVEKNIGEIVLNGSEEWVENLGGVAPQPNTRAYGITLPSAKGLDSVMDGYSNKLPYNKSLGSIDDVECFKINSSKNLYIRILKSRLQSESVSEFKKWLQTNNILVKYQLATPQFIPLPHDQQIKLRTFANKTNISFGCEIEGTIKAQVPKSLGATVNTHTEQISNLNKELDRVKKLEESTVSTVETESDFTTVEATSNGYFEDVKLEGKTLVNLARLDSLYYRKGIASISVGTDISNVIANGLDDRPVRCTFKVDVKPNTKYTIIHCNNNINNYHSIVQTSNNIIVEPRASWIQDNLITTNSTTNTIWVHLRVDDNDTEFTSIDQLNNHLLILEGDHTQNPPSFFEGLKSVGQSGTASEDVADEIVVKSVKGDGNLFDKDNVNKLSKMWFPKNGVIQKDNYESIYWIRIEPSTTYTIQKMPSYRGRCGFSKNKPALGVEVRGIASLDATFPMKVTSMSDENYLLISGYCGENYEKNLTEEELLSSIQITKGSTLKPYTPHQSDEKRLLYYNEETQTWEKPILRQWDSIEKHSDGKYYYHQRSGEVVFDGSDDEGWSVNNSLSSDNGKTFNSNKIIDTLVTGTTIADKFPSTSYADLAKKDYEFITNNTVNWFIKITPNKLITQDLTGFKQWLQANNVTVVYQLAQEKVYECTNIDLITYANETNYIVECGAIVPRTTLKVHNNISNVVSLLQKKVSLLESNVTSYMITQNRLQLSSTYSADSVTFKVDYAVCSENRSQENYNTDLYNLILNNILVGKDNYDYDHMFNIIMDYASWSQISWGQFDILVGIMDLQHNPPIEPPIEEVPCETPEE